MNTEHLGGNTWRVTDGEAVWTVALPYGANTAAGALAAVAEMLAPPPALAAELEAAARAGAARAECRRRILAVVNETAQINLAAAAAADLLPPADRAAFAAGLGWIAAMRAAWPVIAAGAGEIADDTPWPPVPAGLAELAARF